MDRHDARALEILTAIEEGRPLSQRALAERLGIALGLVNLYLRRMSRKGYVKITEFPADTRIRGVTWSHDGTSLVLGRQRRDSDIVLLDLHR